MILNIFGFSPKKLFFWIFLKGGGYGGGGPVDLVIHFCGTLENGTLGHRWHAILAHSTFVVHSKWCSVPRLWYTPPSMVHSMENW